MLTGGETAVALFWVPLFSCLLQTMVSIYAVDFLSADTLPQGLDLREPYNASLKWSIHSHLAFSSSSYLQQQMDKQQCFASKTHSSSAWSLAKDKARQLFCVILFVYLRHGVLVQICDVYHGNSSCVPGALPLGS